MIIKARKQKKFIDKLVIEKGKKTAKNLEEIFEALQYENNVIQGINFGLELTPKLNKFIFESSFIPAV